MQLLGSVYDPLHFSPCCGSELRASTHAASCQSQLVGCQVASSSDDGEFVSDCRRYVSVCLKNFFECVEAAGFDDRPYVESCGWPGMMAGLSKQARTRAGAFTGSELEKECMMAFDAFTTATECVGEESPDEFCGG